MAKREHWGSRIGFILAAAGSAIGLGNIWKFPYIAGQNGGAAFVVVYLGCIVGIGFPLMLAEFAIGRKTQKDPLGAFRNLRPQGRWFLVGGLGILASFLIFSYYSVVAGWTLGYIYKAASGVFSNFAVPEEAGVHFASFVSNPWWAISCHAAFMSLCMVIVIGGIKAGIERWSKILMPILFLILVGLVLRGITLEGSMRGVQFFLKADFTQLNWTSVLTALGHAFFTLSLAMGIMITYGSYLSKEDNLVSSAFMVVFLDTLIALMAGLAIFSSIFAMGLDPAAGPGLTFHILPAVFQRMPAGILFGTMFFLLLAIAALTSGISLLEVVVTFFIDEKGWSRRKAVLSLGSAVFILGILTALSFGVLENVKIFGWRNFFEGLDFICANLLLPIGALLTAIFVGWVWGMRPAIQEVRSGNPRFLFAPLWSFLIRFVSPVAVAIIIVAKLMGKAF